MRRSLVGLLLKGGVLHVFNSVVAKSADDHVTELRRGAREAVVDVAELVQLVPCHAGPPRRGGDATIATECFKKKDTRCVVR